MGNDPSSGYDSGLNFAGYRFNAPKNLTYNAYVGKMDFHLDSAGKHTFRCADRSPGNDECSRRNRFPGSRSTT